MLAAPNECEIVGEVLNVQDDPSGKWRLEIRIEHSVAVSGPNFARPGEVVRAFSLETAAAVSLGLTIESKAEFVGDERGGAFKLFEIRPRGR